MMNIAIAERRVRINAGNLWWLLRSYPIPILTAFFVSVSCCSLAYWQWHRAIEKSQLLMAMDMRKQQGISSLDNLEIQLSSSQGITQKSFNSMTDGLQISQFGYVIPNYYWLWDNRIYQGQIGYDVIALFYSTRPSLSNSLNNLNKKAQLYIVNLGWVKAPPQRQQFPNITLPTTAIELTATLYTDYGSQFTLPQLFSSRTQDKKIKLADSWPKRIQVPTPKQLQDDIKRIPFSKLLEENVDIAINLEENIHLQSDFMLMADKSILHFQPHFKAVVMPPEKHHAYMWQWLLLALAAPLIALGVIRQHMRINMHKSSIK